MARMRPRDMGHLIGELHAKDSSCQLRTRQQEIRDSLKTMLSHLLHGQDILPLNAQEGGLAQLGGTGSHIIASFLPFILSVQGPPVLFTRASNSWITSKWPSNLESGILFLSALGGFPDLQKPQRME
ncbi:hypothetical protein HYQ44_003634 [Verticillium longisporum]|nr:hypothetical protein HYQ44_003634 [Verticillium longisporum]